MKELYKNKENKVLCGVIGGVGEYFQIDPTILRLGYVIACFLTGIMPLSIVYVIACFIVPELPKDKKA